MIFGFDQLSDVTMESIHIKMQLLIPEVDWIQFLPVISFQAYLQSIYNTIMKETTCFINIIQITPMKF